MTKTVEVDFSIKEILTIARQRLKLIILFIIAFAVICGVYGYHKSDKDTKNVSQVSSEQREQNRQDTENYEIYQEAQENQTRIIQKEFSNLYMDQKTNPLFSIDPYQCEFEQIVIRFADGRNYDKTVSNWISEADDHRIFGESAKELSKHKNSLFFTGEYDFDNEDQYDADETVVQIIAVEGFDSKNAAQYLSGYIREKADAANMDITGLSSMHHSGYNSNVESYVRKSMDSVVYVYNSLNGVKNTKSLILEPSNQQTSAISNVKTVVKYLIAGVILGLMIGVGIAIYLTLRKGCIISARQVEDSMELDILSDFSKGSDAAVDILNANIYAITENKKNITTIGVGVNSIDEYTSEWNKSGGTEYIVCDDIFGDAEDIEKISDSAGVILCLRLGESRIDQIQRVILRADKLGKPVFGYVLV